MVSYVASPELADQPLLLKRLAAGDYSVTVKDLRVGRIMQKPLSGGRCVWLWSVTGPYVPETLQPSSGMVETLEEAKAAFKAKFEAWKVWTGSQNAAVIWHTGAAKLRVVGHLDDVIH